MAYSCMNTWFLTNDELYGKKICIQLLSKWFAFLLRVTTYWHDAWQFISYMNLTKAIISRNMPHRKIYWLCCRLLMSSILPGTCKSYCCFWLWLEMNSLMLEYGESSFFTLPKHLHNGIFLWAIPSACLVMACTIQISCQSNKSTHQKDRRLGKSLCLFIRVHHDNLMWLHLNCALQCLNRACLTRWSVTVVLTSQSRK